MPNSFRKSRPVEEPYAVFEGYGGWEWRILKTYKQPSSEAKDPYARWFVAARSPLTFGSWDLGDTYRSEILKNGRLVKAEPEFYEAYREVING